MSRAGLLPPHTCRVGPALATLLIAVDVLDAVQPTSRGAKMNHCPPWRRRWETTAPVAEPACLHGHNKLEKEPIKLKLDSDKLQCIGGDFFFFFLKEVV